MARMTSANFQAWESRIHSFVEICSASKNEMTGSVSSVNGMLTGMSVGVKDIIDIEGLPTRNGSAVNVHAKLAAEDASVVASLREAGARIIGKTKTTEYAFTDPTNCRNPYDLQRSPGGSSSGSGAAVAAGLVNLALGTQTAGSLCRPAAYCGVVGFKPTYGILPTTGVTPLAPSFDTVGVIASSVNIAHQAFLAMAAPAQDQIIDKCEVISTLLPTETIATSETLDAFQSACAAVRHTGHSIGDRVISANIGRIVEAHRIVMLAEAAKAHSHLLNPECIDQLQPKFRAGLVAGVKLSATEIEDARKFLLGAKNEFWAQLEGVDVILTLPVPEAAPLLDGTTGFQDWLTPWTVFGGPLVCLPWGLDSIGRPRSVMLTAFPG